MFLPDEFSWMVVGLFSISAAVFAAHGRNVTFHASRLSRLWKPSCLQSTLSTLIDSSPEASRHLFHLSEAPAEMMRAESYCHCVKCPE